MEEPQIIDRLWENTRFFKAGLVGLGFNTGLSESPITPVIVGEGALAMKLSDRLFEEGVFAQGIAFPTVAHDKARVRTIVAATHTREELQFALDAVAKVGRELGVVWRSEVPRSKVQGSRFKVQGSGFRVFAGNSLRLFVRGLCGLGG